MMAIISLVIMVAILGLVLTAHISANRDDRKFSAPNDRVYNNDRQVVYTQKQIWKKAAKKPSLKEQLDAALENEEYEIAAKLRDQINKQHK